MKADYSRKNLQKVSFINQDLSGASFANSDLRGADFSNSNLSNADFSNSKTGITPSNALFLFVIAIIVSMFSGYLAMVTGQTVQSMYEMDANGRRAGILTVVIMILFIVYSIWKGVGNAILKLIIPVTVIAFIISVIIYLSGVGTGIGMLYFVLSIFLVALMFIVGTVSRAAAGSLSSNILFLLVAMGGAFFGRSLGGGLGTVVMAVSCAVISKRALSGAHGFESLQKIAGYITRKYGTSFRNSKLSNANFTGAKLRNSDFSNADISSVNWGNIKKLNCIGVK